MSAKPPFINFFQVHGSHTKNGKYSRIVFICDSTYSFLANTATEDGMKPDIILSVYLKVKEIVPIINDYLVKHVDKDEKILFVSLLRFCDQLYFKKYHECQGLKHKCLKEAVLLRKKFDIQRLQEVQKSVLNIEPYSIDFVFASMVPVNVYVVQKRLVSMHLIHQKHWLKSYKKLLKSARSRCMKYASLCKTLNFSIRNEGLSRIENFPTWNVLHWVSKITKKGMFNPHFVPLSPNGYEFISTARSSIINKVNYLLESYNSVVLVKTSISLDSIVLLGENMTDLVKLWPEAEPSKLYFEPVGIKWNPKKILESLTPKYQNSKVMFLYCFSAKKLLHIQSFSECEKHNSLKYPNCRQDIASAKDFISSEMKEISTTITSSFPGSKVVFCPFYSLDFGSFIPNLIAKHKSLTGHDCHSAFSSNFVDEQNKLFASAISQVNQIIFADNTGVTNSTFDLFSLSSEKGNTIKITDGLNISKEAYPQIVENLLHHFKEANKFFSNSVKKKAPIHHRLTLKSRIGQSSEGDYPKTFPSTIRQSEVSCLRENGSEDLNDVPNKLGCESLSEGELLPDEYEFLDKFKGRMRSSPHHTDEYQDNYLSKRKKSLNERLKPHASRGNHINKREISHPNSFDKAFAKDEFHSFKFKNKGLNANSSKDFLDGKFYGNKRKFDDFFEIHPLRRLSGLRHDSSHSIHRQKLSETDVRALIPRKLSQPLPKADGHDLDYDRRSRSRDRGKHLARELIHNRDHDMSGASSLHTSYWSISKDGSKYRPHSPVDEGRASCRYSSPLRQKSQERRRRRDSEHRSSSRIESTRHDSLEYHNRPHDRKRSPEFSRRDSFRVNGRADPVFLEHDRHYLEKVDRSQHSRSPYSRKKSRHDDSFFDDHTPYEIDEELTPSKRDRANRAIETLRDIHKTECDRYRANPAIHPDYKKERAKFMKNISKDYYESGKDPFLYDFGEDFNRYWLQRIEEIFHDSWIEKRDKCLSMMKHQKKISSNFKMRSPSDSPAKRPKRDAYVSDKYQLSESVKRDVMKKTGISEDELLEKINAELQKTESILYKSKLKPSSSNAASKSVETSAPSTYEEYQHAQNNLSERRLNLIDSSVKGASSSKISATSLQNSESSSSEYSDVLGTLGILTQMPEKFNDLAVPLSSIYKSALRAQANKQDLLSIFFEQEREILKLAARKLKNLQDLNLSFVQKVIITEAYDKLVGLLFHIHQRHDPYFGLNLDNLSDRFKNSAPSEAIACIKEIIIKKGYGYVKDSQVLKIYMAIAKQ